jgi:hypothetical protein
MQETIIGFVPTSVGPTKLELALAECKDLSDESKTKVCLIQDIVKIGKLLGVGIPSPEQFNWLYDQSISMLEAIQHNAQIEWNTRDYHNRMEWNKL